MNLYGEEEPPFLTDFESDFITDHRRSEVESEAGNTEIKFPLKEGSYPFKIIRNEHTQRKIPNEDREPFEIRLDEDWPGLKRRVGLGHELGHTYNRDIGSPVPEQYVDSPSKFSAAPWEKKKPGELFADEIGRHILVPTPSLERRAPTEPSLNDLLRLSGEYRVTKDIMAQRLVADTYDWNNQTTYWNNATVVLTGHEPGDENVGFPEEWEIYRGSSADVELDEVWEDLERLGEEALEGGIVEENRDEYQVEAYHVDPEDTVIKPSLTEENEGYLDAGTLPDERTLFLLTPTGNADIQQFV
jgi:hypothetical protein